MGESFFRKLAKDITDKFKKELSDLEQEKIGFPICPYLERLPQYGFFHYCRLEFPDIQKLTSTDFLCIPLLRNHCMGDFKACNTYDKYQRHIQKAD